MALFNLFRYPPLSMRQGHDTLDIYQNKYEVKLLGNHPEINVLPQQPLAPLTQLWLRQARRGLQVALPSCKATKLTSRSAVTPEFSTRSQSRSFELIKLIKTHHYYNSRMEGKCVSKGILYHPIQKEKNHEQEVISGGKTRRCYQTYSVGLPVDEQK